MIANDATGCNGVQRGATGCNGVQRDAMRQEPCEEHALRPGDMLFIPRGTWHYVKATAPSVSVNFWWGPERAR